MASKKRASKARKPLVTDKVIGMRFYKGRAGHGVALVHERREHGKRSDMVETYAGPVMRGPADGKGPPFAMIAMVVDGMEYLECWLLALEANAKYK